MSKHVIIRVDGSKKIGLGHIFRQISLALQLQNTKVKCTFIVRSNKAAADLLNRYSFNVIKIPFNLSVNQEIKVLSKLLKSINPDLMIIDMVRAVENSFYIQELKRLANPIIAFTDAPYKQVINVNAVISSDPAQQESFYKNEKRTKYYLGLKYVLLDQRYQYLSKKVIFRNKLPRVFVCLGGADHHQISLRLLKIIDKSALNFQVDVVLNSTFYIKNKVISEVKKCQHPVNIFFDVKGVYDLLRGADIAITSGGLVHLERMGAAVAGMAISQIRRQEQLIHLIASKNATIDLGYYSHLSSQKVLASLEALLKDAQLRDKLIRNSRNLVDGQGLRRVLAIINNLLYKKK